MKAGIQYSYGLPTHYDCCPKLNAIIRPCALQEKHFTSACDITD